MRQWLLFTLITGFLVPVHADKRQDNIDILTYGTESQIIGLCSTLGAEKDNSLNTELVALYQKNNRTALKLAILDLFTTLQSPSLSAAMQKELQDYRQNNSDLNKALLRYAGSLENFDQADLLIKIIKDPSQKELQPVAIQNLGKNNDKIKAGTFLLSTLQAAMDKNDYEEAERYLSPLAQTQYAPAAAVLGDILTETMNPMGLRQKAAAAMGIFIDNRFPPLLAAAYDTDNINMQGIILSSLANYPTAPETKSTLESALKSDEWRIRLGAISSFGTMKDKSMVGHLIFKAKQDPENRLKDEAVRSLGKINSPQANAYLAELFADEQASSSLRLRALEALLENEPAKTAVLAQKTITKLQGNKITAPFYAQVCSRIANAEQSYPDLYGIFLDDKSAEIVVIGIAAIKKHQSSRYKSRLEEIADKYPNTAIGRQAKAALEVL